MTKTIWTYWHQGFEHVPFVVQKCVKQMQRLHPNWEIHLLDKNSVFEYVKGVQIKEEKWDKLSIQHQSDLLRTQLLITYGGVWMDPTVFCVRSLDEWLLNKMDAGIFLFYKPGKDRIIANWFIAAEKNNALLKEQYIFLCDYWNKYNFKNLGRKKKTTTEYWINRIIGGRSLQLSQLWLTPLFTLVLNLSPYMIYHYMFYRVVNKDNKCRQIFKRMPKISANLPHRIKQFGVLKELNTETKNFIDKGGAPVFKLKWQVEEKDIVEGSVLDYLFRQ